MLTQEALKSIMEYNPETGDFVRIKTTSANAKKGSIAGCKDTYGRTVIRINNTLHYAHRLAWLYMYGEFPKELIDHIDMDKGNNRLENLREANKALNAQNKKSPQSNNKTGFLGVSYAKWAKLYRASIHVDGKTKRLGYFKTAEDAHAAYIEAKRSIHPFCTI